MTLSFGLRRFSTYVVMIHQRHRRTDRQTDGRTDDMQSQDHALHYSASRGKNRSTTHSPFGGQAERTELVSTVSSRCYCMEPIQPAHTVPAAGRRQHGTVKTTKM